jgi:hypothetical protein
MSTGQFSPPGQGISSLNVGVSVRVALKNNLPPVFGLNGVAFFNSGGWTNVGDDVNDSTAAIKIFPALGGPMATWYKGNYPDNETWWSEDAQGLAHDDEYWYITQKNILWKWPLSAPLDSGIFTPPAGLFVGIPSALTAKGYDHFGDLDQYGGYLFIPLQNGSDGPLVAALRTSDLALVATSTFTDAGSTPGIGSFVAVRKQTNCATEIGRVTLIASGDLDSTHPLLEWELDMAAVTAGQNQFLKPNPRRTFLQALDSAFDEDSVGTNLKTIQGGAFSPDGRLLYLLTGYCDIPAYLSVYFMDTCGATGDTAAIPQARSSNGYGPFDFEKHSGDGCTSACTCLLSRAQEPEGLDYFDTRGKSIPGVTGQVHGILISNDLETDHVWLKHYSF